MEPFCVAVTITGLFGVAAVICAAQVSPGTTTFPPLENPNFNVPMGPLDAVHAATGANAPDHPAGRAMGETTWMDAGGAGAVVITPGWTVGVGGVGPELVGVGMGV